MAAVFTDDDTSAFSGRARPAYNEMMTEVVAGNIDAIVAWHPDRLHRSPRELESFIDVVEAHGTQVATCLAGTLDLATPAGRMTARIVGAVARHESEHKSARLQRKALELAEAGKVGNGGTRPFGYEVDRLTVRPSEAALVKEAARRVIAGQSVRSICADWTRRAVPTVTGAEWTILVLTRVLTSPRVAGLRAHRGRVVGTAVWPGIIDPDEWHQVVAILTDPARNRSGGRMARSYLLTGIAHCGLCGAGLVARPKADGRRCYVCASGPGFHGCGKIRILADTFEDFVSVALFTVADGAPLAQAVAEVEGKVPVVDDDHAAEIARLHQRQDDLAELWAAGELGRAEWVAARRVLQQRLDVAQAAVARVVVGRQVDALVKNDTPLGERWEALDLMQRRAVVSYFLADVLVDSAVKGFNKFSAGRIRFVWAN